MIIAIFVDNPIADALVCVLVGAGTAQVATFVVSIIINYFDRRRARREWEDER